MEEKLLKKIGITSTGILVVLGVWAAVQIYKSVLEIELMHLQKKQIKRTT